MGSLVKILFLFILSFFFYGCSVKMYSQTRERVDQDLSYIPPTEKMQVQKTRKIYVFEIQTPAAKKEARETQVLLKETQEAIEKTRQERTAKEGDLLDKESAFAGQPAASSAYRSSDVLQYTVLENDTLQKIAKKFYDSYSLWTKIYEANKDKIIDPNHIQPGITISIPPK